MALFFVLFCLRVKILVCFCCCCILFVCLLYVCFLKWMHGSISMFIGNREGIYCPLSFCAYSSEAGSLLEPQSYVSSGGWKIDIPIRAVVKGKCRITSLICRCWYLKQQAQLTAQPSLQKALQLSDFALDHNFLFLVCLSFIS